MEGCGDLFSVQKKSYPDGIPNEVCDLFEKFAFEAKRSGMTRFSSDAILHRIRWYVNIEKGNRDFKCNNNWTATLSRWLMMKYPIEMNGFFETRISPQMKPRQDEYAR